MSLNEEEVAAALERMHRALRSLPACSSQQEVVDALTQAAATAHPDWTVPSLSHELTKHYGDGSVRVMLNAHLLLINPNGAYRIIDARKQEVFYEHGASSGEAFEVPAEFRF
ncbi:hypothetical protein [uncultured Xanthomonas sp.]|uniref:hypothetical protein n=1 Tax=uncultured Xanthomonas sp. TaxID=152831 RepID=UPI0025ECD655|nr:hypothetical protein [uncultured Xanthomonas sp.]